MFAIEHHHEPIISIETYNLAKDKLDNRIKKPIRHKKKEFDFISSILFCAKCNSNYKRTIRKDYHGAEVTTYRCGKIDIKANVVITAPSTLILLKIYLFELITNLLRSHVSIQKIASD